MLALFLADALPSLPSPRRYAAIAAWLILNVASVDAAAAASKSELARSLARRPQVHNNSCGGGCTPLWVSPIWEEEGMK